MEQNKSPFVVTIMASPRPDGNVAKLLDAAERGAKDAGANVTRLTLSHMTLRPCIACMKCRTSGSCILPHDDAHDTATLLAKADSVIIATPVYWSSIPGTLKLLLDRLVYAIIDTSAPGAMPKQLHHGARLGIICACTAPWPLSLTQTRPTVKALRRIFRLAGYTVYPAISVTGTNNTKPLKPAILKSATVLGSKLSVTCRSRNH